MLKTLPRSMCRAIRDQEIPLSIPRRDARVCACLHACGRHVSTTDDGEFAGVGGGTCTDCDCPRWRPMYDARRARLHAKLQLLAYAGREREDTPPDYRTTMAELRTAFALSLGANPDYICPVTGMDMARAETIDPSWCCADGHRGVLTPRPLHAMLVINDLSGEGGLTRTPLLERRVYGTTIIPRQDWRAWHRWTLSRVHEAAREHGWYTPHRRIEAFTVDLTRERVSGWRGYEPLGATVDARWGEHAAGAPPVVDQWWDR